MLSYVTYLWSSNLKSKHFSKNLPKVFFCYFILWILFWFLNCWKMWSTIEQTTNSRFARIIDQLLGMKPVEVAEHKSVDPKMLRHSNPLWSRFKIFMDRMVRDHLVSSPQRSSSSWSKISCHIPILTKLSAENSEPSKALYGTG